VRVLKIPPKRILPQSLHLCGDEYIDEVVTKKYKKLLLYKGWIIGYVYHMLYIPPKNIQLFGIREKIDKTRNVF
jgi:hypothetical protein